MAEHHDDAEDRAAARHAPGCPRRITLLLWLVDSRCTCEVATTHTSGDLPPL